MKYIADASLFIIRKRLEGDIVTVPSVVEELREEAARTMMELMNVRVEPPLKSFKEEVRSKAGITRDSEELSGTDIDILAKALEYSVREETILVTDDFAIQNTAIQLGIRVMPAGQRKIKDILLWEKQCTGCKRRFPEGDICPVCGSPLKKVRKKKIRTG
ncbi:putative nucleic acid-binding protein with PIN domain and Zn ribbon [Candidatus Methanoperedens nitroreducens]|uniref:Putative nucleic acid-binding protein with PIN domain and Zn ribbon n=1 Tax=Candidatus Methanoperedens nitratireducens TaxID=1392998 RepID=A0A062V4W0_9EURY|nr:NOB1 family endonuclease [Candidatus Methanoperedens nitroreducens]KCZ71648.1 putative nucleic acid-binding protein with PIN domain and Zn ribbon [Candidatus Methanoperedens nitroreducens]MDJ1421275.1 NOB1 family endonuclease [Candidatus Methanoperedens sp.]